MSTEDVTAEIAAALAELADDFASNVDWSNDRNNYGDNEAWESAARQVRELAASDALADLLAARDRRVRADALREAAEAIDAERASIEPKNYAAFAARLGMSNAAHLVRDKADA